MNFIGIQHSEKCTNCFKCVQNCHTKAIKLIPEHNSVDIDMELCVKCGFCTSSCKVKVPFIQTNVDKVEEWLNSGKKVHLILDTIYQSDFENASFHQMKSALIDAGFANVIENFKGFALHRYLCHQHYTKTNFVTIESFCVTFNKFISKFYPDMVNTIAPVATPENISSRLLKEEYGEEIYTVYATTCFASDAKASSYDCDAIVLTSELPRLLSSYKIDIYSYPLYSDKITEYYFESDERESIDTIGDCVSALDYIKKHPNFKSLISPHWCDSCFSTPVLQNNSSSYERKRLYESYKNTYYNFIALNSDNIAEFGDLTRFKLKIEASPVNEKQFTDTEINNALISIGRIKDSDCFDCGACGYETCRKNAIAMLQGKSTASQCIPYISQKYLEGLNITDKAYKELDEAFALTIPNSRLEKKLKHTKEYKDVYIKETGKIKITGALEDGSYRHIINALKIAADLHSKGVMAVIGFDKDIIVKTIIFHDIGKSQPLLEIGDEVYPKEIFEDGKLHAERSAELALANYATEGINNNIYMLIKYHHHSEKELPSEFPEHLLPMYRLFRIIDGISAGLTRRGNTISFDLLGSTLYIKEYSQNPNYRRFYCMDLYKPEYMKKVFEMEYEFDQTLASHKNYKTKKR